MAIAILRYVSNYGTPPAEKEVTLVSGNYTFTSDDLPVLTCNGYSFAGWFFDGEYIEAGDVLSADDGEVIELYAGWGEAVMPTIPSPEGYAYIFYNSEYGNPPQYILIPCEYHALTEEELPVMTADGYIFEGWTYNGHLVTVGDIVDADGGSDVYLYAQWKIDPTKKYVGRTSLEHYHGKMVDYVGEQVSNKVEKVEGKGLSTEDYSTTDKTKVAGVEDGAKNTVILMASWTKDNVPRVLILSIAGDKTTYQFTNGMTWGDWVASTYNTTGYYVDAYGYIHPSAGGAVRHYGTGNNVKNNDVINELDDFYIYRGGPEPA